MIATKKRAALACTDLDRMIGRKLDTITRHRKSLITLRMARAALARFAR